MSIQIIKRKDNLNFYKMSFLLRSKNIVEDFFFPNPPDAPLFILRVTVVSSQSSPPPFSPPLSPPLSKFQNPSMAGGGGGGGGRGRGARVAAPAGDSGKGAQAEWLRIYDGIVAMLRKTQAQVEELVAERDHLAAFVKIQHDFMVSRVGRLQSSLQQVVHRPRAAPSSLLGFLLR